MYWLIAVLSLIFKGPRRYRRPRRPSERMRARVYARYDRRYNYRAKKSYGAHKRY